jgi:hypothetical protein
MAVCCATSKAPQAAIASRQRSIPNVLWSRVHRQGRARVDRRGRRQDRVHRTRKPLGERLLRELQLKSPRRTDERGAVL